MADYVPDADFNGDAFVVGAEGERPEEKDSYKVVLPDQAPYNVVAAEFKAEEKWNPIALNVVQRNAFLVANYARVRNFVANDEIAAKVAYYRLLAVKYRLIHRGYNADNMYIRYQDIADNNPAQLGGQAIPSNDVAGQAVAAVLNAATRESLRVKFMDYICLLAWVFKVRGHHYLPDFANTLNRVWGKMRYDVAHIPIPFEIGFTIGLHAIPPLVLERAWRRAAHFAQCDGALIKRLDSAPAGAAIIPVIDRGLADIGVVLRGVPEFVQESLNIFQQVKNAYYQAPLTYSVNARLYGLERVRFDEGRFGVLAAYIMGIYNAAAAEAPLKSSKALERVASSNPITAGLMQIATEKIFQQYAGDLVYGPILQQIANQPANQ